MRLKETFNNGIGIVSLIGNLVPEETVELKSLIKPYLEDEKYVGLICNMDSVNHIDSSGVGVIVSIFKSLKRYNKKFALSGLNERNRELLNISKLDRFLIIAQNDELALQILENMPLLSKPAKDPEKANTGSTVPPPPMTAN